MSLSASSPVPHAMPEDLDPDRRFGALDRLYGVGSSATLAGRHVVVAGAGGVGSWALEALARSGVGRLTLIDMDHVAESNINRQVQAVSRSLGQAKVAAMSARIHDINPACIAQQVDDFISPDNVATLMQQYPGVWLDCTDQVSAKLAMVVEARVQGLPLLVCGGAGGKTDPFALRAGDLSQATHDALLARIRQQLRKHHGWPPAPAGAARSRRRAPRMGVHCLWFGQETIRPAQWGPGHAAGLSCAGYGSAVTITATMGLAAAHWALQHALAEAP
ncbi:ThiF family adenylyltransferase [Castellaniella sp.]|uniref:tRNA threonylcarbamoyladenosine dehydratase n=1 Tax=Castellaniella sp. TaxID=1955812 RepID=UPI00356567F2